MKRIYKLLNILLEEEKPVTTKKLGALLQVSDRTIRSDLSILEQEVERYKVKVIKKSGVGIWLEGNLNDKQRMIMEWDTDQEKKEKLFTPQSRQRFILFKLLYGKSRMYVEYFASELYVSKSTIEKDLQAVIEALEPFHLKLEQKNNGGLYVSGDEIGIRKAIAHIVNARDDGCQSKGPFGKVENMLDVDLYQIKNILVNAEKKYNIRFSYLNFNNIVIHLAIILKRIQQGKSIVLPKELVYDLSTIDETFKDLAAYISDKIDRKMHIQLPENEKYYVLMHILGAHIETQKVLDASNDKKQNEKLAEKITNEFIEIVGKIIGFDLSMDATLHEGLKTHLLPTLHRIQYDLNLYNPILQDIKVQYFYAYELSWSMNSLFEKYLGKSAGEAEIGFIALHLAVAIERKKKKTNIAVVCATGVGISRLMTIRLEAKFPQVNILNIGLNVPTKQIEEQVDLILSTVPIETEKPCIQVSPLLKDDDVNKIQIMLKKIAQKPIQQLFGFGLTLFSAGGKDKKEYLKDMACKLENYGNVQPEFYDSVLWREKLSSTEVGKKVVLTHGFPEYVIHSRICINILSEPIIWDELPVQLIVMIAMNKEDLSTHAYDLDWLYKCLDNEIIIEDLVRCKNANDVKEILLTKYQN